MTEKLHAKFSASGSERWMKCHGSIQLSEKAPPSPDNIYSIEGTEAHEVLEKAIIHRSAYPDHLRKILKEEFPDRPKHMHDNAIETAKFIKKVEEGFEGSDVLIEQKVMLPVSIPDQFGTLDIAILDHFGVLTILDYKYGKGIPVLPEHNTQLIYYALGMAHKLHYNFSTVNLGVIQPRLPLYGKTIRTWSISMEELMEWRGHFERAVRECLKPNPQLFAGNHCRFCPAKNICPERGNQKLRDAQSAFSDDFEDEDVIDVSALRKRNQQLRP